ncbi:cupin-like domain-containing protein [Aquincola sp. S2]|uniref:Cupin-like domain-containing protein n=1 Tax=Pseudaquabacterium terrae TaxID=2732868 RepID=A0ABX2ELE3_9BURK|nr:cupin-like domain-containing protein [Aquabacterium terrae]NRF69467.1 cupin-like domain-containing protein [Aquabacterium terrae]
MPIIPRQRGIDAARFAHELMPAYRPVVLEGLVDHWPAVAEGARGADALAQYLAGFASSHPVDAVMVPPGRGGRIFYDETLAGFNFLRRQLPVSALLEQVLRYRHFDAPPSVAVQSALISDCLPGFAERHLNPLLPASVAPRLWLGNRIVTPAHFDESCNIACVVAGRRRFTLFEPGRIADLYIGPLGFAPTGTPISLVDFDAVDETRFPRFRSALADAWVAELAPGDALYIPPLWWHHVRSLDAFNLMVNYWWPGGGAATGSALDVLLHAVMVLRPLPAEQRAAWAQLFAHYVFGPEGAAVDHLPPERRAMLATMRPALAEDIRAFLRSKLDPAS